MSIQRMTDRVAESVVVGVGYVRHRKFAFHKRSVDGSAKANAMLTDCEADRVWGVVYRIPQGRLAILDDYESLGVGYDREELEVIAGDGIFRAWMYVARHEAIDETLKPYCWYRDFVLRGARQHQLPQTYIDHLAQFDSISDPDPHRQSRNQALIG